MNKHAYVSPDLFSEISQLLANYCWFIDENRPDEWASMYTADGIFEGTRAEPIVGYDALLTVPTDAYERFGGKVRHQFGNLLIQKGLDERRVTARFYNQISVWDGANTKLLMMALCTAILVKAEGRHGWLIERNSVEPLL